MISTRMSKKIISTYNLSELNNLLWYCNEVVHLQSGKKFERQLKVKTLRQCAFISEAGVTLEENLCMWHDQADKVVEKLIPTLFC